MFKLIGEIGKAVGGAVGEILGGIDKISTTEEEKLAMKAKLMQVQTDAQLKLSELGLQLAQEQAGIIKAEIASDSWLAANWRPIGMLAFIAVILYAAVVAPIFGFAPPDMSQIPEKFWTLVTVGFGGYIGGRTVEKIAPAVAEAYKSKKSDD